MATDSVNGPPARKRSLSAREGKKQKKVVPCYYFPGETGDPGDARYNTVGTYIDIYRDREREREA